MRSLLAASSLAPRLPQPPAPGRPPPLSTERDPPAPGPQAPRLPGSQLQERGPVGVCGSPQQPSVCPLLCGAGWGGGPRSVLGRTAAHAQGPCTPTCSTPFECQPRWRLRPGPAATAPCALPSLQGGDKQASWSSSHFGRSSGHPWVARMFHKNPQALFPPCATPRPARAPRPAQPSPLRGDLTPRRARACTRALRQLPPLGLGALWADLALPRRPELLLLPAPGRPPAGAGPHRRASADIRPQNVPTPR